MTIQPRAPATHICSSSSSPFQVDPGPNQEPTSLVFGGITDALLASLKQSIGDLAQG